MKDLNRYLQTQGSGPWPTNRVAALERSAGELIRILESRVSELCLVSYSLNILHYNIGPSDSCIEEPSEPSHTLYIYE